MKKQGLMIENGSMRIPAVLWGEPNGRLLLAVHGMSSNKEDTVIELAAKAAEARGYCTLSYDLPEHGARAADADYACNPWNGRSDLLAVYHEACSRAGEIGIFACSLGAYHTMLCYPELTVKKLLFLSPMVNMENVVKGMMAAAGVTEERLEREKLIPVQSGPPLDWEYYCYVREHPVCYTNHGKATIAILRGEKDMLCTEADATAFARWYDAGLTLVPCAEHFFYQPQHLEVFGKWMTENL